MKNSEKQGLFIKNPMECPMNEWFQLSQKCLPNNND